MFSQQPKEFDKILTKEHIKVYLALIEPNYQDRLVHSWARVNSTSLGPVLVPDGVITHLKAILQAALKGME